MREILFRGKRKDILPGNEWVYGCLVNLIPNEPEIAFAVDENEMYQYEAVVDETVGQYTGLTDKNGKKIFDGDIVNVLSSDILGEMYETTIVVEDIRTPSINGWLEYADELEVIGNIHDNPELLKGE